jgi:hypothetical protein
VADSARPRDPLASLSVLDVTPVRLADWEDHEDHAVVLRPHPRAPWYLLPLEWLRYLLAVRRIRLDAMGSAVWRGCDGSQTVAEIALDIRASFGADAEPAEQRVGLLIRRLRREGLLAYRDHDDTRGLSGRAVPAPHP